MATQEQKNASDLGEQAIALAEQLGRIAGTIEGTAESWMNRQQLADQLTRVRDGATQMLEGLTAGVAQGSQGWCQRQCAGRRSEAKSVRSLLRPLRARQADPAHAPGKRRRKPAPSHCAGVEEVGSRQIPKVEIGGSEPSATEELPSCNSRSYHSGALHLFAGSL